MRHPRRAITREIRTRQPKRRGREWADLEALTWPETIRVREVMTRPPVTIRWDQTVEAAWTLMRTRKIRHLPVLDDGGRLVGIVTDRDLRQVVLDPAIQAQLGRSPRALRDLLDAFARVLGEGIVVKPERWGREA